MLQPSKYLFIILMCSVSLTCFFGCRKVLKTKQEIANYIQDPNNGLRRTEKINELDLSLTYEPWQMLSNTGAPLKNNVYFVFGLSKNNREVLKTLPYSLYSQIVQILAFNMSQYIVVTSESGKVISLQDWRFLQTYGLSHENRVFIVVKKSEIPNSGALNFKIKEFGLKTGDISFKINVADIKNVPQIKL